MNTNLDFELQKYNFNNSEIKELVNNYFANNFWPLIYILSCEKKRLAYIGETTDTLTRMAAHLKHDDKSKLSRIHLITSEKFNKSATLDIESSLIKYISADGEFNLLNGNLGLSDHNYYQKKSIYDEIFKKVWDKLRSEGIAKHSLEYINNSDLFKYSPYKSLSYDQRQGLLTILESLLDNDTDQLLVEGGAGTGKTILAVFIFKLLNTDTHDFNFKEFDADEAQFVKLIIHLKEKYPNPKMGLVVPMTSFRGTLKKVFSNIVGLSANMVIGPSDVTKEKYDILVVDESHRLRKRVNLTNFASFDNSAKRIGLEPEQTNELEWVLKQSNKALFFYDSAQSIKPTDVNKSDFEKLRNSTATRVIPLVSQFRVLGGRSYIDFINSMLQCKLPFNKKFKSEKYEFLLFRNFKNFLDRIKLLNSNYGLSRIASGYAWEWKSKNKSDSHDIEIEGIKLKWNAVNEDWINTENSIDEVGCIHTTQGYDLNYAGIIFGREIDYCKITNTIIINKDKYFDKNGKNSIRDPIELKNYIINIYQTMMLRGIKGTFIYAYNKDLREYFEQHIPCHENYQHTPKIKFLGYDEFIPFKNSIPFYDLKVAAGNFSEAQLAEHKSWVELSNQDQINEDYFVCEVVGNSMNRIIPDGSVCLFKKDIGGSRNGKIVLVEQNHTSDDETGSRYTVKEYHSKKIEDKFGWTHSQITLSPKSNDRKYKDIVLDENSKDSYKIVGIFIKVIE
jgi:uncharacterized protein